MNECPVTYRGTEYPSISAAAKAIGCNRRTLHTHLEKYGHIENVGKNYRVGNCNAKKKPVTICGREFESIAAAASHYGISRTPMSKFVNGKSSRGEKERMVARLMRSANNA